MLLGWLLLLLLLRLRLRLRLRHLLSLVWRLLRSLWLKLWQLRELMLLLRYLDVLRFIVVSEL